MRLPPPSLFRGWIGSTRWTTSLSSVLLRGGASAEIGGRSEEFRRWLASSGASKKDPPASAADGKSTASAKKTTEEESTASAKKTTEEESTASARKTTEEEREAVHPPPPPPPPPPRRDVILVAGGNGFVGSEICREAVHRGFAVASLNRSGEPKRNTAEWVQEVEWIEADALKPESYKSFLNRVQSVISCVGAFGSPAQMRRICGEANERLAEESASEGVERFVFLSASSFKLIDRVEPLRSYYEAKRSAEATISALFPSKSVILRPSFIYGVTW